MVSSMKCAITRLRLLVCIIAKPHTSKLVAGAGLWLTLAADRCGIVLAHRRRRRRRRLHPIAADCTIRRFTEAGRWQVGVESSVMVGWLLLLGHRWRSCLVALRILAHHQLTTHFQLDRLLMKFAQTEGCALVERLMVVVVDVQRRRRPRRSTTHHRTIADRWDASDLDPVDGVGQSGG